MTTQPAGYWDHIGLNFWSGAWRDPGPIREPLQDLDSQERRNAVLLGEWPGIRLGDLPIEELDRNPHDWHYDNHRGWVPTGGVNMVRIGEEGIETWDGQVLEWLNEKPEETNPDFLRYDPKCGF